MLNAVKRLYRNTKSDYLRSKDASRGGRQISMTAFILYNVLPSLFLLPNLPFPYLNGLGVKQSTKIATIAQPSTRRPGLRGRSSGAGGW